MLQDGRTIAYVLHAGEQDIRITQNDVRAIQLAKAALHAGAKLLMEHFGVTKVDRIRLAGAFGAHIDVKYAMILGLIPECDLRTFHPRAMRPVPARASRYSTGIPTLIEAQVREVEKIETAVEPSFRNTSSRHGDSKRGQRLEEMIRAAAQSSVNRRRRVVQEA